MAKIARARHRQKTRRLRTEIIVKISTLTIMRRFPSSFPSWQKSNNVLNSIFSFKASCDEFELTNQRYLMSRLLPLTE